MNPVAPTSEDAVVTPTDKAATEAVAADVVAAGEAPTLAAPETRTLASEAVPALTDEGLVTPAGAAQLLGSLFLVLIVIVALGWLSKRLHRLQPRRGRSLQVIDVLPVGTRERVALVQVGSTQLVLGLAPGRVQTLHVFDGDAPSAAGLSPDDQPTPASTGMAFASLLKR